MAADAVASVVLQKLSDLQADESFASNKIIGRRLKRMRATLETTSSAEAAQEEAKDEEIKKQYLGHLYCIEDSIESFALRFTRQRKKLGFLMNHALFLKKFTALNLLDIKLCNIQTKVKKLNSLTNSEGSNSRVASPLQQPEPDEQQDGEEMEQLSFSSIEETEGLSSSMSSPQRRQRKLSRSSASMIRERLEQSKLMYSYSYNEEELPIVGEIQNRLEYSDNRIIRFVGELGSGKTMLARAVYGNRTIIKAFNTAAWANVFNKSTTTDILLALLNQVKKSEVQDESNEESLKQRLTTELDGRRYLVVLDGVQTSEQWERLKDAFPDQQNGSRIIITTCDERVAKHDDPESQMYNLERMNPEVSWGLFMRKVGIVGSQPEPEASLKKRIIEVCYSAVCCR